jgi:hypothetical protein
VSTTVPVGVGRSHRSRFALHALQMAFAMVVGMVLYVVVVGLVFGDVEGARLAQPELYALGMATAMSVPMVAWMRRHGHAWRLCIEMTIAMFVPYLVFIVVYWLGGLSAGAICPLGCATTFPAMIAAMLYRRSEYI